jgi:hypothetical protein
MHISKIYFSLLIIDLVQVIDNLTVIHITYLILLDVTANFVIVRFKLLIWIWLTWVLLNGLNLMVALGF